MEPVLRWRAVRMTIAIGLVGGFVLALFSGYVLALWLFRPMVFLGLVVAAIAAPFAASAVWRGKWSPGESGAVQRIAVGIVAAALAGCAVLAAIRAVEEHSTVRALGVPTESGVGPWLVVVAVALASLAILIATAPRWVSRTATVLAAAAAALGGAGALVIAATTETEARVACADTRLDRATWRAALQDDRRGTFTDGERIAAAIVECGLLDGRSREEVRRRLGRPHWAVRKRWTWAVGWVNDGLGPGDGQELNVHFGRDGRVTRARLVYPPD